MPPFEISVVFVSPARDAYVSFDNDGEGHALDLMQRLDVEPLEPWQDHEP